MFWPGMGARPYDKDSVDAGHCAGTMNGFLRSTNKYERYYEKVFNDFSDYVFCFECERFCS
jgi:hypothetical protein